MISEIEQETSDIDWFFTNGKEIGFVASSGGKLPNSISNKSLDEIKLLVDYFRSLPQKSEVSINPNLNQFIIPGTNKKSYLSYFIEMTEKGLFSFDKSVSNRFSDTNYHLVTKPMDPFQISDLPLEILKILTKTTIKGDIGLPE